MSAVTTKHIIRWSIIVISLYIVSLFLWNTYVFFEQFKKEERQKMEILAMAYQRLLNNTDLDADITIEREILDSNTNIPVIATDSDGNIVFHRNLDFEKTENPNYLNKVLSSMKAQNKPLVIDYKGQSRQYIYYADSSVLTRLKHYPLGLILILLLFSLVIFLYNRSNTIADQNMLWTGMAKETAHQIGTPLTSLMGWTTLLKEDAKTEMTGLEMEKDLKRLDIIANRFSKIGSTPVLYNKDLVAYTLETMNYLKSRASQQVKFKFSTSSDVIMVNYNSELYGWILENLIKNALDAMQGKGEITLTLNEDAKKATIIVCDTGKGIAKAQHKKIFNPGYTTKKRGWGLGLSLSKRIVEDFHNGQIFVLNSELGKGTCFQINLPKY